MGSGNKATPKQGTNVEMSNGVFGNSFSTHPIKVENKFDSFKALNGPSSSNGDGQPNTWESQAENNNEAKWDNHEGPVVYGHDTDASDDDVDLRGKDEIETFDKDDLVHGFVGENDDEDSFRININKVPW